MSLFYTSSVNHLIERIPYPRGSFIIKKFSDGEIYVKINHEIQEAWVLASTFPPADNLLELFFLLDALSNQGAKINLLVPYFGYARQSHPQPGEAASARRICTFLKTFTLNKIVIVHVHTTTMHEFLAFENFIPFELICREAEKVDCIASSDKGSAALAAKTGARCEKPTILIEKKRPEHEMVEIISVTGNVEGKSILIVDDIISTGNTILAAAQELKKLGAASVYAYATHAFFSRDALHKIDNSPIEKVFVTNTIPQKNSNHKVKVLDIAPQLEKIITGSGS